MWIFNSKKYINHLWVVWGFTHCSWFTPFILFSLSIHFSPIHYSSFILILAWEGKMNCWRWTIVLLDVMIVCVFQPWINACMSEMHWHVLSFVHSCESRESRYGDSWSDALESWKEVDILRECVEEKGVHFLGLCRLEIREIVYFGLLCVEKPMRDWVLTGLGSWVTLWNYHCGFIALAWWWPVVETWNDNVYGWVERPWFAASWW